MLPWFSLLVLYFALCHIHHSTKRFTSLQNSPHNKSLSNPKTYLTTIYISITTHFRQQPLPPHSFAVMINSHRHLAIANKMQTQIDRNSSYLSKLNQLYLHVSFTLVAVISFE